MTKWVTKGFEAFRRGTFGNSGQNLYVSQKGVLQRIYQYDLNRDGYFDLVFANCQNHSESTPSYVYDLDGSRVELPGQGALSGTAGDLTGNGYDDIVVAGHYALSAPYVSSDIYYGSAGGYSENCHMCIPTPFAEDCCNGDFKGAGLPALAFAMPTYSVIRVFYQSDVGFEFDEYVDLPVKANLVAATDLDGDGYCDLIIRLTDGTETTVYWGGPDGLNPERKTVLPAVPASEILQPQEETTVQSQMEKKFSTPRLLKNVVWQGRNCFILSTGKRLMFFAARGRELECVLSVDVLMAVSAAVSDIDGDGYDDIAVAAQVRNPDDAQKQCSFIIWGGPDGIDKRERTVIDSMQACDVAICDDMVLFCQASAGRSYQNDSLLFRYPDFNNSQKFISQDSRRCFFLKNPDKTRIFIQNHFSRSSIGFDESFVYWGGPDGYSPDRVLKVPGHCAVDSLAADLDDDGWAELLIANNSENSVHLDPGHYIHHFGPNGFEPERTRTIKTDLGWGVIAADFNHDGYLEIVTPANHRSMLRIYYGKDDFNTYDDIPINDIGSPRWICAVDVNKDGWLDIVCPLINSGRTLILWGGPDGFSIDRCQQLAVRHGANVQAADLKHNGWPDLIIGGHTETPQNGRLPDCLPHHSFVYIYWNGPEGISEDRKCVLRGDAADSFAVADFNNDGWPDIFAGSYHNGVDRDTPSFLYWNREGHFSNADKKLLFTHSASGCVAADFNQDGYIDLAVANHKIYGDHHGFSCVWWNGPDGFRDEQYTCLPSEGPHGMMSANPGNIMDRSESEFYYSEEYAVPADCRIGNAFVEGEIPPKTSAELTFSVNGSDWVPADACVLHAGDRLAYRLELKATLCLRTPRITAVCVEFAD